MGIFLANPGLLRGISATAVIHAAFRWALVHENKAILGPLPTLSRHAALGGA
jgi:hypothetical protein